MVLLLKDRRRGGRFYSEKVRSRLMAAFNEAPTYCGALILNHRIVVLPLRLPAIMAIKSVTMTSE